VLANLLSNADRYTGPGGRIRVSVSREGSEAVLRVADNGLGISLELLPRIFDLFTQGERPPGLAPAGLGVGLALVRSLVELHGGRVEAHSPGQGQGSEFVVRLPLAAGQAAPSSAERRGDRGGLRGLRVLVCDDNTDAAESMALLLRLKWGCEVAVTYDGPQALEAAEKSPPQVALLDIGLPGDMDGYELGRQMRRLSPATVVVALTGYGQQEDRQRSQEAGFDAHLTKPADVEALRALLEGAAQRRS
jgi:CheY-like chemotaxis protein